MSEPGHLLPIGDSRWRLWRQCVLRSAGFPVRDIDALADPELAAAADRYAAGAPGDGGDVRDGGDLDGAGSDLDGTAADRHGEDDRLGTADRHAAADRLGAAQFDAAFAAALRRQSETIRAFAVSPRYREAVAWQNLGVLKLCLDKIAAGSHAKPSDHRQREAAVVRYVQRYTVKNDTIGFFGPATWARLDPAADALTAVPAAELVTDRAVYLENWAIAELAQTIAAEPAMRRWLVPRLDASSLLVDGGVRTARGDTVPVTDALGRTLALCDGVRTIGDIAESVGHDVVPQIASAVEQGMLRLDLQGPIEPFPERTLRRRLAAVGDRELRDRALARLDALEQARSEVADAAGDAEAVAATLDHLNSVFQNVTGASATRRPGETYAARTIAYEDVSRAVDVVVGGALLDEIARPMKPLLDAAGWAVGRAAELFEARFQALFDACTRRFGPAPVPLAALVGAATGDLAFTLHRLRPTPTRLRDEMRQRWAEILAVPEGARRHCLSSAAVEADVARLFPPAAASWSAAVQHSPDVMIAAESAEAVRRGDYTLVLGEMHLSMNTLQARVFLDRNRDTEEILRWYESDHRGRRIFPVPSRHAPPVNSRTFPPALNPPRHRYWCMHAEHTGVPAEVTPAAALVVVRSAGELVVESLVDGSRFPLLDVVGEYISGAVVNSYSILPVGDHRPRVQLDRLVVEREAWGFRAADVQWAFETGPARRYRGARSWRAEHDMPEQCFYSVPNEDKPMFVDFTSQALVDILAKTVRQSAAAGGQARVTVTEMLPGSRECWLRDAEGRAYASELRLVMIDSEVEPS